MAWVVKSGLDAELARRMAQTMLAHVDSELLPHRQAQLGLEKAECHVINEDYEAALGSIRAAIDQKQLTGWWLSLNHPMFEPLRLDAVYQQAREDIEQIMAIERARFYQLTTEGAL
jgi:hypothetical protein